MDFLGSRRNHHSSVHFGRLRASPVYEGERALAEMCWMGFSSRGVFCRSLYVFIRGRRANVPTYCPHYHWPRDNFNHH